ncbi:uncharacterized protein N7469_000365 [Penicillium citrinum]|uniref:Uncharacterized protein n=2 Tax=Penicillium TaxID=5073 RepID=A0A9W9PFM4_PENCI|nr:uncharacterized protein N7469_000365 [Penicillium citrinum]KAJ5242038.1 hypothetical protein N7469_000365 [Penicillium citrinum]KAJ5600476.1 hypothetical protein N7450_001543 [Penicillium hetheringtonii]
MSSHAFPGTNKSSQYRSHPSGPSLKPRNGRWYIPLVAAIGLGFGAYNYYTQAQARHEFAILEEEKRLAKNRELMDAYGSKDSLEDVQQALEMYGR